MRRVRLTLILATAVLAAPVSAQSFLGTWTATATPPQGAFSEELTATKTSDGYAIAVLTIDPLPEGTPEAGPGVDIELEEDNFSYKRKVALPDGTELAVAYTGTVAGDTFTGEVDIAGYVVPYNGVRSGQ